MAARGMNPNMMMLTRITPPSNATSAALIRHRCDIHQFSQLRRIVDFGLTYHQAHTRLPERILAA
jgi:hypothetical protein